MRGFYQEYRMKSKDSLRKLVVLALNSLKGIGPAYIKKIRPDLIGEDGMDSLKYILGENSRYSYDELEIAIESAQNTLSTCSEQNISLIDFFSDDFPTALKGLKDTPCFFFCRGNRELLDENKVCVIGTREPNENGAKIAERLGQYFNSLNIAICNGLAEGIDKFAISVQDDVFKKVIGVLAGGLDFDSKRTVNKKTAQLSEKVLEAGGLVISEQVPGKKEDTFSIVRSCRIQAGISEGLILVQSSLTGGSKYTVKSFCEMNRPFAVIQPMSVDMSQSSYEANVLIINDYVSGVSKFTELPTQKVATRDFMVIKSRADYEKFREMLLNPSNLRSNPQGPLTLFD